MKLTTVKPNIFETFDEPDSIQGLDPFGHPDLKQLMQQLKRKEAAVSHELDELGATIQGMVPNGRIDLGTKVHTLFQRYKQLENTRADLQNRIKYVQRGSYHDLSP